MPLSQTPLRIDDLRRQDDRRRGGADSRAAARESGTWTATLPIYDDIDGARRSWRETLARAAIRHESARPILAGLAFLLATHRHLRHASVFSTAQRTREIGIRDGGWREGRRHPVTRARRECAADGELGMLARARGIAGSSATARRAALLYDVSPTDPLTLGGDDSSCWPPSRSSHVMCRRGERRGSIRSRPLTRRRAGPTCRGKSRARSFPSGSRRYTASRRAPARHRQAARRRHQDSRAASCR